MIYDLKKYIRNNKYNSSEDTRSHILFALFFSVFLISYILSPKITDASVILSRPPTHNLGLVGHWTMDGRDINWSSETAGTITDRSGNGNTGTLNNMNRTTSPAIGKIGQALRFSESSVTIANESNFDFERTQPFSVSAWVYRNSISGSHVIASKNQNYGNFPGWSFEATNSNNYLTVYFRNSLGNQITMSSLSNFFVGQWHHVIFTYNGDSSANGIRIYIDGVDRTAGSSGTLTDSMLNNTAVSVGINPASGANWNGMMDDVRIYNRELTPNEISTLYRSGSVKISSTPNKTGGSLDNGLVGHWTFDGKDINWATGKANDVSGNGNHGNIANMSTTTSPVVGRLGQAMNFNGSNNYVRIGTQTHPANFTYSAWIKRNGGSGDRQIVVNSDAPNTIRRVMFVRASGNLSWNDLGDGSNPSGTFEFSDLPIEDNTWVHVVVTYDGTTLQGFKNGTVSSLTENRIIPSTSQILGFGRLENGTEYFPGVIDDVRIYNRALSESEVKQLYNLGK